MEKIFNFFSGNESASASAESKLYEKFDEHKKETDAKIEKYQAKTDTKIDKLEDKIDKETERIETAVSRRIELIETENVELRKENREIKTMLIQHQNTTAQSFNTAHDRMNEQDRRINIIQEQMILSETQKQIVLDQIKSNPQLKQIDPKSAIAPPMEGEVEFLKSIIKEGLDDNHPLVTQAEASLKQTRNKCIDVVFETVVKTSLNLFEYDRKVFSDPNFFNSIKKDDLADMFVEFSKAFFKDGLLGGL